MAYTRAQKSTLGTLHGMLENDPPSSGKEFAKVFSALKSECGVSFKMLASKLGREESELEEWAEGESLPTRFEWSAIMRRVMSFAEDVLHVHDQR